MRQVNICRSEAERELSGHLKKIKFYQDFLTREKKPATAPKFLGNVRECVVYSTAKLDQDHLLVIPWAKSQGWTAVIKKEI